MLEIPFRCTGRVSHNRYAAHGLSSIGRTLARCIALRDYPTSCAWRNAKHCARARPLCIILINSALRNLSILSHMDNLKSNFDKILQITKSTLCEYLYPDGKFQVCKNKPKMADIEVVTLAIITETLGIDSENYLFSKLRKYHLEQFPNFPHRPNFGKRRKRLQDYIAQAAEPISKWINPKSNQYILDSIPIPICQNPRMNRTKICQDKEIKASRGLHASYKMHLLGFKLQLVHSKSGVPVTFGLTPANVHDVRYMEHVSVGNLGQYELISDKGYLSASYQTSLFENDRIGLVTPVRANMKNAQSIRIQHTGYQKKNRNIILPTMRSVDA
jgi:hypothetical protein